MLLRVAHLVRKPIAEGSVGRNVLKHGTGGINIDESRVGTEQTIIGVRQTRFKGTHYAGGAIYGPPAESVGNHQSGKVGRFPSNLILIHKPDCRQIEEAWECVEGCPVKELDGQSGVTSSTPGLRGERHGAIYGGGLGPPGPNTLRGHSDSGGASRYFKQVQKKG